MAQEIQILRWCDWCQTESDTRTTALAYPVATRDGMLTEVDLCESHLKVLNPLFDLAAVSFAAREPERTRRTPTRTGLPLAFACPACDAKFRTAPGVSGHVADHHGFTLPQWEGWTGSKLDGAPVTIWCRTCGGGFAVANAFGAHRRAANHDDRSADKRPAKSVYPAALLSALPSS